MSCMCLHDVDCTLERENTRLEDELSAARREIQASDALVRMAQAPPPCLKEVCATCSRTRPWHFDVGLGDETAPPFCDSSCDPERRWTPQPCGKPAVMCEAHA